MASREDSTAEVLNAVENDANEAFGFSEVAVIVQPCSSLQPFTVVSTEKRHWIEIVLVDEEDNPVVGESFEVTSPEGRKIVGCLDSKGRARIEGIGAGTCKVAFPNLDECAWE